MSSLPRLCKYMINDYPVPECSEGTEVSKIAVPKDAYGECNDFGMRGKSKQGDTVGTQAGQGVTLAIVVVCLSAHCNAN